MISLLRDQLFSPCFFPFLSTYLLTNRKGRWMLPFQTPRPRSLIFFDPDFHIKLVIAYDPARHDFHSGGPCYMNEILWNANIYAHTFAFPAFLIIASSSVLKGRAAVIWYIKLYRGIHKDMHEPQPPNKQPQLTLQTQVCLKWASPLCFVQHDLASWLPSYSTVVEKVICQRMN